MEFSFTKILLERWQQEPLMPVIHIMLPLLVLLGFAVIYRYCHQPLPKSFYFITIITVLVNLIYGVIFECGCIDKFADENTLKMTAFLTVLIFFPLTTWLCILQKFTAKKL